MIHFNENFCFIVASATMLTNKTEIPAIQLGDYTLQFEIDELSPERKEVAREELRETPEIKFTAIEELRELLKSKFL